MNTPTGGNMKKKTRLLIANQQKAIVRQAREIVKLEGELWQAKQVKTPSIYTIFDALISKDITCKK